jgi:hypothetical protein
LQGDAQGEMSWGDIEWLNTWVMFLGNNSGLLSFACCLKAGKRIKLAFSGFFSFPFKDVTVEDRHMLLLLADGHSGIWVR